MAMTRNGCLTYSNSQCSGKPRDHQELRGMKTASENKYQIERPLKKVDVEYIGSIRVDDTDPSLEDISPNLKLK